MERVSGGAGRSVAVNDSSVAFNGSSVAPNDKANPGDEMVRLSQGYWFVRLAGEEAGTEAGHLGSRNLYYIQEHISRLNSLLLDVEEWHDTCG